MKSDQSILQRDIDLAKLIAAKDQCAFEKLYQQTHRRVYGICLKICGNPAVAEDLCQETYIQVWNKIGKYNGTAKLSTWIHRIAVNQALMHFRKKAVKQEVESIDSDALRVEYALKRYTYSPEYHTQIDLEQAIEQLPDGYKQVFLLKEKEGLEHWEVAEHMGVTEGTSKSQLSKARQKMRKLLNKKCNPRLATNEVLPLPA